MDTYCSRCGLKIQSYMTSCPSCGMDINMSNNDQLPVPQTTNDIVKKSNHGYLHIFGWRFLEGTVIHIDQPYMTKRESEWGIIPKVIMFIIMVLIIGPIFLGVILSLMIFLFALSFMFGGRISGFFQSMMSQIIGFFLTRRLFGNKVDIIVRDIRVRDSAGFEHLVRLKGDMITGSLNVGDEVQMEGFERGGTLMFRRGWNRRIHAEIRVKNK